MLAQSPITWASHRGAKPSSKAVMVSGSVVFADGSRDTVTLVSEVLTRSMLRPTDLKTAKASAKKPTVCHIPTVSMLTKMTPRRIEMAFTPAPSPAPSALMIVPSSSGFGVQRMLMGIRPSRHGGMARGWRTFAPMVATSWASL